MKIKTKELKYVADLARIKLTEKETGLFSKQLNSILEYIDKLKQLDTKKVEPMSHALEMVNIFREDKVKKSLGREKVLENAPSAKDGFFEVPKVI